jgi:hypothetical protein
VPGEPAGHLPYRYSGWGAASAGVLRRVAMWARPSPGQDGGVGLTATDREVVHASTRGMLNAGSGNAMTLRNKAHSPGCSGYRLHRGLPGSGCAPACLFRSCAC